MFQSQRDQFTVWIWRFLIFVLQDRILRCQFKDIEYVCVGVGVECPVVTN